MGIGEGLAALLTDRPDESDYRVTGDFPSLNDILVTAFETSWYHWRTRLYDPDAPGTAEKPWAIVEKLGAGMAPGEVRRPLPITPLTLRAALARTIDLALVGTDVRSAFQTYVVDVDAVAADAIVQVLVYGEVIFS